MVNADAGGTGEAGNGSATFIPEWGKEESASVLASKRSWDFISSSVFSLAAKELDSNGAGSIAATGCISGA